MTTIYVGGQNAVDNNGNLVGKNDIGAQTEKALRNLETALKAGGAELHNVIKWNVYIVAGQSVQIGFRCVSEGLGSTSEPTCYYRNLCSCVSSP